MFRSQIINLPSFVKISQRVVDLRCQQTDRQTDRETNRQRNRRTRETDWQACWRKQWVYASDTSLQLNRLNLFINSVSCHYSGVNSPPKISLQTGLD